MFHHDVWPCRDRCCEASRVERVRSGSGRGRWKDPGTLPKYMKVLPLGCVQHAKYIAGARSSSPENELWDLRITCVVVQANRGNCERKRRSRGVARKSLRPQPCLRGLLWRRLTCLTMWKRTTALACTSTPCPPCHSSAVWSTSLMWSADDARDRR